MTENNDWPNKPITVTDANFNDFIQRYPYIVVDCWAPWCAPCIRVAPIIEELNVDYKGKIVFGKLNTDENQKIMKEYNIMSIPTLLIFKNGKLKDRSVGALPREELEPVLKKHL
jgi:thioredoxin 1